VAFCWGDVRDERSFPPGPFDFLLDCSAEPSVLAGRSGGPDFLLQTNLVGACHCLEKARLWGSRLLFLSSSRVYPIERLERHPWREEATRFAWADQGTAGISSLGVQERLDMSGARSLYGYTKYATELLVEEYRAAWGLKAVVDRCGIIAGPWQFGKADQGVASLWVLAHYFGRPLSYIGYGGQGKQVRDFLHIDDLCELLAEQVKEFDRWEGWLGNVAGGLANSASLCELTALCQEITGRRVAVQSVGANRPWDLRLFLGDCRRLFERTAWRPRRGLRQLVSDLAEWAAQNEPLLRNL
jgi:CDP-paratose 2-epimerase